MSKRSALRISVLAVTITILILSISFGSFYAYWNAASPSRTCGSCHEIGKSVDMFAQSAHRDLVCSECHGTALSNGFHSLLEKSSMVVHHVKKESVEDIRMNEDQVLAVMENCRRCHTDEYAKWMSGGHSALYHDIFLDKKHNETEQLNADCLRCHGMFSDSPVKDIVEPLDKTGPWKFKDTLMADKPVIPCMACHQTHREGLPKVNPDYSAPAKIFYMRQDSSEVAGLYYRPDRRTISAEFLPKLILREGERQVKVSDDILMRNCIQCHSPNAYHQAGTADDRTPRGVHEGLSCIVCHETHSNDASKSCLNCHPAISNCKLDVTKMNTTFRDAESPNNIHWVACTDCHREKGFTRKMIITVN
jgi:nitrate/TMAO reductase-like tetraheme cytochrome c subunit